MSDENNNNGLYFMVGGLLVAVLVIGGLYLGQTEQGEQIVRESNTVIEKTVEDSKSNESGSSFNLKVDDEGFSASSENNN